MVGIYPLSKYTGANLVAVWEVILYVGKCKGVEVVNPVIPTWTNVGM